MGKIKYTKEDKEWAKKVKERYYNKCAVCGSTKMLNAHHLIPRQIKQFKHDVRNGISLCPSCHRFSFKLSAHQNPIMFISWLNENRPEVIEELDIMTGGEIWLNKI